MQFKAIQPSSLLTIVSFNHFLDGVVNTDGQP